ncbi:hypothetical protein ACFQ1T_13560, partial [Methylophilus glucosoxydans]
MSSNRRPGNSSAKQIAFNSSHKKSLFKLAPIAAAVMTLSAPANAATIVWDGSTNDWFTESSWSDGLNNIIPGLNDIAEINNGFVNLDISHTVLGINHTGGTIGGSGSLLTTVLNWFGYGSTQKGNGTTTVSGNATIGDGNNYSYQHLGNDESGRTLNLNGNTAFQSAALNVSKASVINNNGTFTSKGDVRDNGANVYDNTIQNYWSSDNTFNNAGTFVQDASGKQTSINTAFNNSGTVNVKSGTL